MKNIENIKILVKEIQNLFLIRNYHLIINETRKALKKYPEVSIFYNMLGLALSGLGRFEESIIILKKGIEVNKNDLAIINNLANAYKSIFNFKEAENFYKLSISKNKDYLNAYVNYGNLKRDLNKFNDSIKLYKNALSYNDKISGIHYALALAYQGLGDFKNSEYHANRTLELDHGFTRADLLISRAKKYNQNDSHLSKMTEKLKDEKLNSYQKINLYFALAKAYEDLNQIDKSFEYLKRGNDLKRANINFDLNIQNNLFKDIKDFFSKVDFNKFHPSKTNAKKTIFILGMPRSGTTLTEQILSAHSKVYGAGELPYLMTIINEEFITNEKFIELNLSKFLKNKEAIKEISHKYLSYLREYQISEDYITDKAPLNFLWIGFIKILFPNSKIIHCKRDPKDNCISIYKNFFEANVGFSYNPEELSKYYNLYKNLMAFWEKKIPNAYLNIEYEKLVSNPKDEIKRLLNYCELDWEDNCYNFSNNKTPIKTASVAQARKSIYATSLKSYSKYEIYLKDFFKDL